MRVGIIAEGPTDQRVIEEILKGAVRGGDDGPAPLELHVNYVHPEAQGFGGWALVFDALRRGQHVEELECWLLPLVFDNNKAGKTTGCFEALHHRLKERKGRGLLHHDGQIKDPRRYRDEAAPLRKPKQLDQACEHSASLAGFVLRVQAMAAAYRITGPPRALAPP